MELRFFRRKSDFKTKEEVKGGSNTVPFTRSCYSVTEEEIQNYANGLNSDLKVIHFTHTDIGGKVCSLLAQKTFSNIKTVYCSNNDVDDIINTFVLIDRGFEDYDLILVSDVTLNKGTLVNLDNVQKFTQGKTNVRYYNHQEFNIEYMEKYPWIVIETEYNDVKQDSASLFYRHLQQNYNLFADDWLDNLVEKSRRYTKWEWIDLEDNESNQLSMLCHDMGHEFFVKKLIKKHISNSNLLEEEELDKLEYLNQKYIKYRDKKLNEVILTKIGVSKVGIVFAEDNVDNLCLDIAEAYKNLDFIIVINSLVRISIRKTKNCTSDGREIAKIFGGNGDKSASGGFIPVEIREVILNTLVEEFENKLVKSKK